MLLWPSRPQQQLLCRPATTSQARIPWCHQLAWVGYSSRHAFIVAMASLCAPPTTQSRPSSISRARESWGLWLLSHKPLLETIRGLGGSWAPLAALRYRSSRDAGVAVARSATACVQSVIRRAQCE